MAVQQPSGFGPEILEPFSIPTGIGGGPPMQAPPRPSLTFPVFTPPSASSYGTTNPMEVPWKPPDLAGAINAGLKTGASLATDALTNRKTLQQIQAEEAAQKVAIARAHDPNAAYYTTTEVGPQGTTIRQISPAEAEIARYNLAKTQADIEASRAATARSTAETAAIQQKTPGQVAETQANIQAKMAEIVGKFSPGTLRNPGALRAAMKNAGFSDDQINQYITTNPNPGAPPASNPPPAGSAGGSATVPVNY